MCTTESIQGAYNHLTECVHDTLNNPFLRKASSDLSEITSRVSLIAQEVWKQIDTCRQYVDLIMLRIQKGISSYIKSALSSLVARFVLYSLELSGDEYEEHVQKVFKDLRDEGSQAVSLNFPVSQNATLSIVTLCHPPQKNPDKKTIIYFPRNFEIWQKSISFLQKLHQDTGADIHAINYRGTGDGTGFPEVSDTLIQDGLSYVQSLDLSNNNIVLFGDDIGAAVAKNVAGILELENINLDVVSVRSFICLSELIRRTAPIAPDFCANFAEKMHWKLDVEAALRRLKGRLICVYAAHDPIIPSEISVKAFIETAPENTLKFRKIELICMDEAAFKEEHPQMAEDPDCNSHIRPFAASELNSIATAIKALWVN